jgi:hypothetical protein
MNINELSKIRKLNGNFMVGMHFVRFFLMVTITKKLIITIFKWYVVLFVIAIISMYSIPKPRQK